MEEFISKVAEMRRLQKLYFRSNHNKYILMECKKAESEVDEFINDGQLTVSTSSATVDARQPRLF